MCRQLEYHIFEITLLLVYKRVKECIKTTVFSTPTGVISGDDVIMENEKPYKLYDLSKRSLRVDLLYYTHNTFEVSISIASSCISRPHLMELCITHSELLGVQIFLHIMAIGSKEKVPPLSFGQNIPKCYVIVPV